MMFDRLVRDHISSIFHRWRTEQPASLYALFIKHTKLNIYSDKTTGAKKVLHVTDHCTVQRQFDDEYLAPLSPPSKPFPQIHL